MSSIQNRLVLGAGFVVVIGLLLPAIFGGRDDIWGRFIYDYQTLITGILAVFAAAVAVSQSAAADASQERRHREQLFISQRRDVFAVSRLSNDLTQRLKYVADRSQEFSQFNILNGADWSRDSRTTYLSLLRASSRLLDKLDSIGEFERSLFDARLEVSLTLFHRVLADLLHHFPDRANGFPDLYPNSNHAPEKFDQGIRDHCIALGGEACSFLADLARWQKDIEDAYRI